MFWRFWDPIRAHKNLSSEIYHWNTKSYFYKIQEKSRYQYFSDHFSKERLYEVGCVPKSSKQITRQFKMPFNSPSYDQNKMSKNVTLWHSAHSVTWTSRYIKSTKVLMWVSQTESHYVSFYGLLTATDGSQQNLSFSSIVVGSCRPW